MAEVGDVFYYTSLFLINANDGPHYHPAVHKISFGSDGSPKTLVVVITTYREERFNALREERGEDSVIILEQSEYSELSHRSMISTEVYQEDELNLLENDKRSFIDEKIIQRIKKAAKNNRRNTLKIRNLL